MAKPNKKNFDKRKDSWEDRESKDEKRDFKKKGRNRKTGAKSSPSNDPKFYNLNQQLITDAASIPYSIPTGSRFNILKGTPYKWANIHTAGIEQPDISMPGVMVLHTLPTYGKSTDSTSAINICAQNMYSYVRHANSGHTNYDSPDLMMYLLAMDSIYTAYIHLCRIYGIARTYAQQNRYFPYATLYAMNVDPTDIVNNLANFRYGINSLAIKIGSLCVPSSLTLYQRHMQIFSGYYLDAPIPQAQIFEFAPYGFWEWEEIGEPMQPGKLTLTKVSKDVNRWTAAGLLQLVNRMVDVVLATEDFNIMSGDILKAFGEGGLIKIATISEDYTVMPTYDPVMSMQLHNTTVVASPSDQPGILAIENDPDINAIISDFYVDISRQGLLGKRILDTPTPVSVPDVNMEASRLSVVAAAEELNAHIPNFYKTTFDHYGSEIVLFADIWHYIETVTDGWALRSVGFSYTNSHLTSIAQIGSLINDLSKFSSAPLCLMGTWSSASSVPSYSSIIGDVTHFTVIEDTELRKMHETALLSEFKVPQMGAFQP